MNDVVLELKGISKKFGEVLIAENVDISLEKGRIYALIGPNGAGKTTLLNIINGFIKPDAGRVILKGEDITMMEPWEIARMGVGRLFQNIRVFKKMKGEDNMLTAVRYPGEEMPLSFLLLSPQQKGEEREAKEKACKLAQDFKIFPKGLQSFAEDLSFGQEKLLALARLLMGDFEILLLDEPVAGVQPAVKRIIYSWLKKLRDEGKTIVVVEHEMEAVKEVAEEVLFMSGGKVVYKGPPEKALQDQEVVNEYIGIERRIKKKKKAKIECNEPLLMVKNIHAGYGKRKILHGINMEVYPGEILALIGPNGAGKTTLLRVLAGLIPAEKGKVFFQGKEITRLKPYQRIRMGIGYFIQGGEVFPGLSVLENLEMAGYGMSREEIERILKKVLEYLPELEPLLTRRAGLLSGGERHFLALGMVLMSILGKKEKGKLILWLDEPSAGVSPEITKRILTRIETICREEDASAILVEQKVASALDIADRICIIKNGRVSFQGAPSEVSYDIIEKIWFGNEKQREV